MHSQINEIENIIDLIKISQKETISYEEKEKRVPVTFWLPRLHPGYEHFV